MNSGFEVFIGIDQTGAWDRRARRAKPLPMVKIAKYPKESSRFLLSVHALSALTPAAFRDEGVDPLETATLILVDCVFWPPPDARPEDMSASLWHEFKKAHAHSSQRGALGALAAEDFFKGHHRPPGTLREIDRQVKSQSLYSPRPFQRNIQCGTYRIWSELGSEPEPWARVWPWLGSSTRHPSWIAEGYPSRVRRSGQISWKHESLRYAPAARRRIQESRDFEDAALLALQAFSFGRMDPEDLAPPPDFPAHEGWIFGVSGP